MIGFLFDRTQVMTLSLIGKAFYPFLRVFTNMPTSID